LQGNLQGKLFDFGRSAWAKKQITSPYFNRLRRFSDQCHQGISWHEAGNLFGTNREFGFAEQGSEDANWESVDASAKNSTR
jgi:hypothetical protein